MLPVTTTAKPSILSIKFIELIIKTTQSTDIIKFKNYLNLDLTKIQYLKIYSNILLVLPQKYLKKKFIFQLEIKKSSIDPRIEINKLKAPIIIKL